jgi:pyroglutamyl-peptidase
VRALLTGFEPFLTWPVNPSQEVVRAIAADPPPDLDLRAAILPVSFAEAGPRLVALLDELRPELVLMLGQGGGGSIRVERVGINLNDLPGRADNNGVSPEEEPIDPAGPDAYFATIPVRRLVRELLERGIPSVESRSAGTFLCNHVLYAARHHADRLGRDAWIGFLHLPMLPAQAAAEPGAEKPASMALELQVAAVRAALAFLTTARSSARATKVRV